MLMGYVQDIPNLLHGTIDDTDKIERISAVVYNASNLRALNMTPEDPESRQDSIAALREAAGYLRALADGLRAQ
jgi:hypothetical protein